MKLAFIARTPDGLFQIHRQEMAGGKFIEYLSPWKRLSLVHEYVEYLEWRPLNLRAATYNNITDQALAVYEVP